jgi:hypothetical protein
MKWIYLLLGASALVCLACEAFLKFKVVDTDGKTDWSDDDSKDMAKQNASDRNDRNSVIRVITRTSYVVALCMGSWLLFTLLP